MRTAWLECATGISGDMTLAALIDAGADPQVIRGNSVARAARCAAAA